MVRHKILRTQHKKRLIIAEICFLLLLLVTLGSVAFFFQNLESNLPGIASTTGFATSDTCIYKTSAQELAPKPLLPEEFVTEDGLRIVAQLTCDDFPFTYPDEYSSLELHRCLDEEGCTPQRSATRITTTLVCDGVTVQDVTSREEEDITSWYRSASEPFIPVEGKDLAPGDVVRYYDISFTVLSRESRDSSRPTYVQLEAPSHPFELPEGYSLRSLPAEFVSSDTLTVTFTNPDIALYTPTTNSWLFATEETTLEPGMIIAPVEICVDCSLTRLLPITTREDSREAVVLVHGFLTDPSTFARFVGQLSERGWPWNIYVSQYDYTKPVDELSKELAFSLESFAGRYDRIVLVGHSFGGFVTEGALSFAAENGARFLDRLESAVLIATPHDGSPLLTLYESAGDSIIGRRLTSVLVSEEIDPANIEILREGRVANRVSGIRYIAIAGTRSYPSALSRGFDVRQEINDGVTSVRGAQRIGDTFADQSCVDFYSINLTHTEILEHPLALRMIERVIAQEFSKQVKFVPTATIDLPSCTPGSSYVLLGARSDAQFGEGFHDASDERLNGKLSEQASDSDLPAAAVCSCGDGICGTGETAALCPQDCASLKTNGPLCFIISPIVLGLFLLVLVLSIVHVTLIALLNKTFVRRIVLVLLCLALLCLAAALLIQHFLCSLPVFGELVVFALLVLFVGVFEAFLRKPEV